MTAVFRDRQDRHLKLVLAVLLLVLLLLQVRLWSGAGSLADIDRLQREIALQQRDNAVLQERNEAQRQEVNDLKSGVDSIEERARSELGLIRKGETFVLIVDKAQPPVVEPAPVAARLPAGEEALLDSAVDTLPPDEDELLSDSAAVDSIP
jgi:cell division protein FtsB